MLGKTQMCACGISSPIIWDNTQSVSNAWRCQGDLLYDLEISPRVWHVPNPSIMLFWDDLRVPRRSRILVKEGDEVVILIDSNRANLFSDDLAENAVLHVTSSISV